jgi:hypothetical protein
MGSHQTKTLLHSKETTHKMGGHIHQLLISQRGNIQRVYKELNKQVIQSMNGQMIIHFSKEETVMANKHMKKCPISLSIREMQSTTMKDGEVAQW